MRFRLTACVSFEGGWAVYYLILFMAEVMLMWCCAPVPHRVHPVWREPHLQTPFEMFVIYRGLGRRQRRTYP